MEGSLLATLEKSSHNYNVMHKQPLAAYFAKTGHGSVRSGYVQGKKGKKGKTGWLVPPLQ